MQADRFALPLRETLESNRFFEMTLRERLAEYKRIADDHEDVCAQVELRLAIIADRRTRPGPLELA